MRLTWRDGVALHWRLQGDPAGAPLVLLNSIGTDMSLWAPLLPSLRAFRVLCIDTRGHGGSDAPKQDYSLAMLAADVAAVMDDAGMPRAAVAGVSLGGMIAMELALRRPDIVQALILICTSAAMDRAAWAARTETVRREGMEAITPLAIGRFFSQNFIAAHGDIVEKTAKALGLMRSEGYAGCAAAIRDMELASRLAQIAVPSLVITGDDDVSTPFEGHGDKILNGIPDARLVRLPCAHLAPLEAPAALARSIIGFLEAICSAKEITNA